MISIRENDYLLKLMAAGMIYNDSVGKWSTAIIDHEGRDYYDRISQTDRLAGAYLIMRKLRRRCYHHRVNLALVMGLTYKLQPEQILKLSRRELMRMMRQYSKRSRWHYYSRFMLTKLDPRQFKWPEHLSHNHHHVPDTDAAVDVALLRGTILGWLAENGMAHFPKEA